MPTPNKIAYADFELKLNAARQLRSDQIARMASSVRNSNAGPKLHFVERLASLWHKARPGAMTLRRPRPHGVDQCC